MWRARESSASPSGRARARVGEALENWASQAMSGGGDVGGHAGVEFGTNVGGIGHGVASSMEH
eukprot:221029-Chlamydomonas_euryale.AAC.1